jgi:hypothetical protein
MGQIRNGGGVYWIPVLPRPAGGAMARRESRSITRLWSTIRCRRRRTVRRHSATVRLMAAMLPISRLTRCGELMAASLTASEPSTNVLVLLSGEEMTA